MLVLGFVLLNGALVVGSQPKGVGTPENITVQVIDSKTVEVFWSTSWKNVERYDISYNPTENRVVSQAAGNSHSIILRELRPNTQYQVTVTAVVGGKNYKSRRLVFRTSADQDELEEIQPAPTKPTKSRKSYLVTPEIINPDPTAIGSKYTPQTSTTVRGVEIGLVLLALVVWIIAIALFFHRWGKIRMLLPYQPDYKTQQSLKVPGTGTTIVSGCTGTSSSQGNQDGPGCVQHLRWSTRYIDEPPTANKCSPGRRPLRPRGTSAVFPASPSFCYARTSSECDSPRIMRHAHSHSEFQTESIPLCQVNQPRSESPPNVISITVPVIASSINEKALNKKNGESKVSEQKKNFDENAIIKFEESELLKKDKKETNVTCLDDDVPGKNPLAVYCRRSFYRSPQNGRERSDWQNEKEGKPSELEPLFFVESTDVRFHESPTEEVKTPQESEKPRRYSRSSLKKQKVRLYDDRDLNLCKNVPIYESNSQEKKAQDSENQKPKNSKTQELRRKAFLRKVSLQDTYLNYNQDYWLDFKKSGRFHKSIDLGYFGTEDKCNNSKQDAQGPKKLHDAQEHSPTWEGQFPRQIAPTSQIQPVKTQAKPTLEVGLKKSDSDPIIFPSTCSCENCQRNDFENGRSKLLLETVSQSEKKEARNSWFFLPSNENIPLFSERNGLIETDFDMLNDMLDEKCLLPNSFTGAAEEDVSHKVFCTQGPRGRDSESKGPEFPPFVDFSNFYEIKLSQSSESEEENVKKSTTFDFDGGGAFFETFASTSGDSDISFKETDPLKPSEPESSDYFLIRSSSPD